MWVYIGTVGAWTLQMAPVIWNKMDVTFAIADLRREAEIIGELAHAVRGRSVMEVGSVVGLTGLVPAKNR